jgi:hypothetical protein
MTDIEFGTDFGTDEEWAEYENYCKALEIEEDQLFDECGRHCGTKDGHIGHCFCKECHGK